LELRYKGRELISQDRIDCMPVHELRQYCIQEMEAYKKDEMKKRYENYKKQYEVKNKFWKLVRHLPEAVRKLVFGPKVKIQCKQDSKYLDATPAADTNFHNEVIKRCSIKRSGIISDYYEDPSHDGEAIIFQCLPIEWGAYFLLYSMIAKVYISGGIPCKGNRNKEDQHTHWSPTIKPGTNNILFFRCRLESDSYLTHKKAKWESYGNIGVIDNGYSPRVVKYLPLSDDEHFAIHTDKPSDVPGVHWIVEKPTSSKNAPRGYRNCAQYSEDESTWGTLGDGSEEIESEESCCAPM
ncbi:MAG TPA: hypothetical protein VHD33_06395, partial [Legionellaceae bacterium]|nr:hypothetical protein [Legionellaceae bacterium]